MDINHFAWLLLEKRPDGTFALSMVHLRAMALMHRREKENLAQEVHDIVVATCTRTTDKILVTFLKQ